MQRLNLPYFSWLTTFGSTSPSVPKCVPKFALKAFSALVIIFIIAGCSNSDSLTPEDQVKTLMASMEKSLEERNLSDVFEHVSENYKDHRGNDKKALRKIAQIYVLRNKSIALASNLNSVAQVDEHTVAVEASILMGARADRDGNLLSQLSADSQQISAVFYLEDQQWKLVSMSWENTAHF